MSSCCRKMFSLVVTVKRVIIVLLIFLFFLSRTLPGKEIKTTSLSFLVAARRRCAWDLVSSQGRLHQPVFPVAHTELTIVLFTAETEREREEEVEETAKERERLSLPNIREGRGFGHGDHCFTQASQGKSSF